MVGVGFIIYRGIKDQGTSSYSVPLPFSIPQPLFGQQPTPCHVFIPLFLLSSSGLYLAFFIQHWRRQWHPTPVLLPGKSHGQRSLVGCSPWGRSELDTTERLHFHFSLSCIGEGNGNPLQCSCLENLSDWGAWWAAVYGVTQSRTRLTQLSSSSKMIKNSVAAYRAQLASSKKRKKRGKEKCIMSGLLKTKL